MDRKEGRREDGKVEGWRREGGRRKEEGGREGGSEGGRLCSVFVEHSDNLTLDSFHPSLICTCICNSMKCLHTHGREEGREGGSKGGREGGREE